MNDVIIQGIAAVIAYLLQAFIFKITAFKQTRDWLLILAGILYVGVSILPIPLPRAGLIALLFFVSIKSYKYRQQAILAATFAPFSFELMQAICKHLIIPGLLPSLEQLPYANLITMALAFILWWVHTSLLQVNYRSLEDVDHERIWYQSTANQLNALAIVYFLLAWWLDNVWLTVLFLLFTGAVLSTLSFRYKDTLKKAIKTSQEEHDQFLHQVSQGVHDWYDHKVHQDLLFKEETEELYDMMRFKEYDHVKRHIDTLLTPSENAQRIDRHYREKLYNIELPEVRYLFEAKFLEAKEEDIWVSMEIPEVIDRYPLPKLDWLRVLSDILDYAIDLTLDSDNRYLSYAYFRDADSQHFVLECSSNLEDLAISTAIDTPSLTRVAKVLERYPEINLISGSRRGIYRLQIEFDMTKGGFNV